MNKGNILALFRKHWPYLLIGVMALLSHGLLLLNDGMYWDGWLLDNHLAQSDWGEVNKWATDSGMPAIGYFYWGLKLIGLVSFYKILAFISLLVAALLVFRICIESQWFTRLEATGIALLSLVYPAYQTTVELSTFRYLVFYCMFLFVILQLWKTVRVETPLVLTLWRRILLLVLLFISFNLNSLLVFYFPLLLTVFWGLKRSHAHLSWAEVLKRYLPGKLDFIALPFIFFAIKNIFSPTSGVYANYNKLNLSPGSIGAHAGNYVENALIGQFDAALSGLLNHPLALLLLFALTYLAYAKYQPETTAATDSTPVVPPEDAPAIQPILFAGLLLASAIFPYAAVGQSPTPEGWSSRHALLASLPVALLVVGLLRPMWALFADRPRGAMDGRFVALLIGALLLAAFSLSTISTYVSWQARAVKDRAIISVLAATPILKDISVFWVDDQYPLGGERLYRFYEWAGMFKKAWGGESRIGFQVQAYNPQSLATYMEFYSKSNLLSEFDPTGCQAGLTIRPNVGNYSETELVWNYYRYKYLDPDGMQAFLGRVIHIEVLLPEEGDEKCLTKASIAKGNR
jgi:hypothetical protein